MVTPTARAPCSSAACSTIEPQPEPMSSSRMPGASASLPRDELVLCPLRVLERRGVVGPHRARVRHRRPEQQPVELVRQVVVVGDRGGITRLGVEPPAQAHLLGWSRQPAERTTARGTQEIDDVAWHGAWCRRTGRGARAPRTRRLRCRCRRRRRHGRSRALRVTGRSGAAHPASGPRPRSSRPAARGCCRRSSGSRSAGRHRRRARDAPRGSRPRSLLAARPFGKRAAAIRTLPRPERCHLPLRATGAASPSRSPRPRRRRRGRRAHRRPRR